MLDTVLPMVSVLLTVAFFTLLERKIMGLMHYRKGPLKPLIMGLSQPLTDATKLLSKEFNKYSFSKQTMFAMGPMLGFMLMIMNWAWFEFSFMVISSSMKIILMFATLGLVIYSLMLMSWGSNSNYAIMGGYRAISQTLSYEVCMLLMALIMAYSWYSYNSMSMSMVQQGLWMSWALPGIFIFWVVLCLAESNRTPFDTAEGESEIVSGFNIEYGSGLFAVIFISEYGSMIILSFLTTLLFMGSDLYLTKMLMMIFVFVWTRSSFPRVRYDSLMMLSWKVALPLSITMILMMMT